MNRISKFFTSLMTLLAFSGTMHAVDSDPIVEKGNIIYTFASGKMQCQSEIDANGHVWVLIKSLDDITRVNFSKIEKYKGKPLLVVNMLVEDKNALCASWVNMQEMKLVIDPIKVEKTSLTGKTIYEKNNITVLQN